MIGSGLRAWFSVTKELEREERRHKVMSEIKIYGIKNCDTMKKAMKWLEHAGVIYTFHDYKKLGVDIEVLKRAIAQHGWENVINRRGTTWRKLPDNVKDAMDENRAIKLAEDNPSVVKRPLLDLQQGQIILGFKDALYQECINNNA